MSLQRLIRQKQDAEKKRELEITELKTRIVILERELTMLKTTVAEILELAIPTASSVLEVNKTPTDPPDIAARSMTKKSESPHPAKAMTLLKSIF